MEKLIELMQEFYREKLPSTVAEYTSNYPIGYSRTALKKNYNLTVSQLLEIINIKYKNIYTLKSSIENLYAICSKLHIKLVTDISTYKTIRKTQLEFICEKCNEKYYTTYDSLKLCTYGCANCAGNKPHTINNMWEILAEKYKEYTILEFPNKVNRNSMTGAIIKLRHSCGTEITRNLAHIWYREAHKMCHNCWPSKVYNVEFEGNTFNSKFEVECYKLLQATNNEIKLHVKYKDLHNECTKHWRCDFIVNNYIIEVTSYSPNSEHEKFISHANNLIEKELFVKKFLTNYKFIVIRSLPELDKFIKEHLI